MASGAQYQSSEPYGFRISIGADSPSREPARLAGPAFDLGPEPDAVLADDGDGLGEVGVTAHEVVDRGDVSEAEAVGDLAGPDQIIGIHLSAHDLAR